MIRFDNKVALVTGGSRGIGRATALLLAECGCDVVINYHRQRKLAELVAVEAQNLGARSLAFRADVGVKKQAEALVNFSVKKMGKLDILVNNAGIWERAPIHKMTEADLNRTMQLNLFGCFYTIMAAVGHMMKRKSGNIVNIASTAAQRGESFYSHYAASKGAIINLTKSLSAELAPYGIRVNSVAPGWVDTDMSSKELKSIRSRQILSQIPLGRPARPEEIAAGVVFLASDSASFVTGEIMNVNGGAVLCG